MDLVKARRRAKQDAETKPRKEDDKINALPATSPLEPRPDPGPAPTSERAAPPAPAPAPPEPDRSAKPEPSKSKPPDLDEVFMDEAFGEDLPPERPDLYDLEDDAQTYRLDAETAPAPETAATKASAKAPAPSPAPAPAAAPAPTRPSAPTTPSGQGARATSPAQPPWSPAAPPAAPPAAEPKPKEKKTFNPVRLDDAGVGPSDRGGARGDRRLEPGWGAKNDGWTFEGPVPVEDDFFQLVTEDLYAREFGSKKDDELSAQLELLSFRLANEVYAVRLVNIQQIIKLSAITRVPRAPDYVLGIISLRGAIIPVFDLRKRLRLPESEPTRKSRIVVVKHGAYVVGLIVDEVEHVVRFTESAIEPPPPALAGVEAEYLEGIGRTGKKMIILLALEKIMVPVATGKT